LGGFDASACGVHDAAAVGQKWRVDTATFATVGYDANLDALRLRGGIWDETSAAVCTVRTVPGEYAYYDVRATMFARSLDGECALEVSTDRGHTWTLTTLDSGDDGVHDVAYDGVAVSQVVAGSTVAEVELRLTIRDADWWDFCYLRNVSVAALRSNPEDLVVPKDLYYSQFYYGEGAGDWTDAVAGPGHVLCAAAAETVATVAVDLLAYTAVTVFAALTETSAAGCAMVARVDGVDYAVAVADAGVRAGVVDIGPVIVPTALLSLGNPDSGGAGGGECCAALVGVSGEAL
jgi:hypothetical protein